MTHPPRKRSSSGPLFAVEAGWADPRPRLPHGPSHKVVLSRTSLQKADMGS
jgi:hypothetical protein